MHLMQCYWTRKLPLVFVGKSANRGVVTRTSLSSSYRAWMSTNTNICKDLFIQHFISSDKEGLFLKAILLIGMSLTAQDELTRGDIRVQFYQPPWLVAVNYWLDSNAYVMIVMCLVVEPWQVRVVNWLLRCWKQRSRLTLDIRRVRVPPVT